MFVVSRQASIATQPAEGPFDNPTVRQDLEAFRAYQASYDVELPAEVLADMLADAFISRISPEQLQATVTIVNAMFDQLEQFLQDQFAAAAVLETGTVHDDDQQQSQGVDHDMTLAASRLLVDIDSALFAACGGLDALAINNRCTRLALAPLLRTHLDHQRRIQPVPHTAARPAPEVTIDRLPGRQPFRQHAPLTTGACHIQDRVHDLPSGPLAGSAAPVARKEFRNQQPFAILQIGRGSLAEIYHFSSLPEI